MFTCIFMSKCPWAHHLGELVESSLLGLISSYTFLRTDNLVYFLHFLACLSWQQLSLWFCCLTALLFGEWGRLLGWYSELFYLGRHGFWIFFLKLLWLLLLLLLHKLDVYCQNFKNIDCQNNIITQREALLTSHCIALQTCLCICLGLQRKHSQY